MFITAEQIHITPEILATMPKEMQEMAQECGGKDVFLTVYGPNGKSNLGSSEEYAILEKFESKALSVMRQTLGITSSISAINDVRKGGSFSGGGCFSVIIAGVGIIGAVGAGIWQITKHFA